MAARIQKNKNFSDTISVVCSTPNAQTLLEIILTVFEKIETFNLCQKASIGVAVEDQGHKAIDTPTCQTLKVFVNIFEVITYQRPKK